MPNWCNNEVEILGASDNPEEFQYFLIRAGLSTEEKRNQAQEYDSKFDLFDRLVPMPSEIRQHSRTAANVSTTDEFKNALIGNKEYTYTNWYDWSLANWGTKWDVDPSFVSLTDNVLQLSYDTAWSPANHVWEQVTKEFPSLMIVVKYVEEGIGFIGKARYHEGECLQNDCFDISTEMYKDAGCVVGDDGEIDWDDTDDYNLFEVFDKWNSHA